MHEAPQAAALKIDSCAVFRETPLLHASPTLAIVQLISYQRFTRDLSRSLPGQCLANLTKGWRSQYVPMAKPTIACHKHRTDDFDKKAYNFKTENASLLLSRVLECSTNQHKRPSIHLQPAHPLSQSNQARYIVTRNMCVIIQVTKWISNKKEGNTTLQTKISPSAFSRGIIIF